MLKPVKIENLRDRVISLACSAGSNGAHVGSSLSLLEILYVCISQKELNVILSKGHGALGLYVVLEHFNYISSQDTESFNKNGTRFFCHAMKDSKKKIEFSGGSLGLGLPFTVGKAITSPKKEFVVIIGDGELDEGICWESLLFCSQNQPKNLTIIIDRNNQQSDGYKDDIISQRNLFDKLSGWGFKLFEVDGHNPEEIFNALKTKINLTKVIIANTIKGKGYSLFEDNPEWHYGIISEKLLSDLKNDGKSQ